MKPLEVNIESLATEVTTSKNQVEDLLTRVRNMEANLLAEEDLQLPTSTPPLVSELTVVKPSRRLSETV